MDIQSSNIINETEELTEKIISTNGEVKKKLMNRLHEILIRLQEIKSEKLRYSQIIQETVENNTRAINANFQIDITSNKTEEIAIPVVMNKAPIIKSEVMTQIVLPVINNVSKPGSGASSSASDTNDRGGMKRLRRATRLDPELERAATPKPMKIETTSTVCYFFINLICDVYLFLLLLEC